MTPGEEPTVRVWVARVAVLVVTLVLALALFELGCRLLALDFSPNPAWKFHPVLGWTQEPGRSYKYRVDGEEVQVEFNRLGFRDVEHAVEKPPDRKRIVLIGDSFSEAVEVSLEQTFFRRLQRALNQAGSANWEVINLGVGDFGHAQAWLALSEYGLPYQPDIVLFQIFPLNDICNNSLQLAGLCKSSNDAFRPYFSFSNGELVLTSSQPMRHWLRLRFYSFGIVERLVRTIMEPGRAAEEIHRERYLARGFREDPLLYTFAEESDQPPPVAYGWNVTEAIFRKIHAVCKARGIRLLPVIIPFEARVGEAWKSFSGGYTGVRMTQDYPERRLGRLFRELDVPHVFLKPVFEAHLGRFLPTRAGHLNPQSHELVARAILEKLEEIGVQP